MGAYVLYRRVRVRPVPFLCLCALKLPAWPSRNCMAKVSEFGSAPFLALVVLGGFGGSIPPDRLPPMR